MLVVFECTVIWQVGLSDWVESKVLIGLQRVRTLTEFRTMSVVPYPMQCLRDDKWRTLQTDKVLPGDVVSIGESPLISH
jgi:manganese-transporting P-type ATPase